LYEKYAAVLMGLCLRYTKNREEAEDVLQEGFIKIFKYIETYGAKGSFEGWMKRIMVNTAINYYKKNKKLRMEEALDVNNARHVGTGSVGAEDTLDVPQEVLLAHINDLPAGYRLVFNMFVFEGLTHREIAGELDISEGTSKSQLAKARRQLRTKVEKYIEQYQKA
jgi:RNA polymerase sigma factor (sigma-70 family)